MVREEEAQQQALTDQCVAENPDPKFPVDPKLMSIPAPEEMPVGIDISGWRPDQVLTRCGGTALTKAAAFDILSGGTTLGQKVSLGHKVSKWKGTVVMLGSAPVVSRDSCLTGLTRVPTSAGWMDAAFATINNSGGGFDGSSSPESPEVNSGRAVSVIRSSSGSDGSFMPQSPVKRSPGQGGATAVRSQSSSGTNMVVRDSGSPAINRLTGDGLGSGVGRGMPLKSAGPESG